MQRPLQVRKVQNRDLEIEWDSGVRQKLSGHLLRTNCPCAQCRELRGDSSHQKPLQQKPSGLRVIESSREEELRLEHIWQVGNYAIGIRWGDGHATGIYTFETLYQLGNQSKE